MYKCRLLRRQWQVVKYARTVLFTPPLLGSVKRTYRKTKKKKERTMGTTDTIDALISGHLYSPVVKSGSRPPSEGDREKRMPLHPPDDNTIITRIIFHIFPINRGCMWSIKKKGWGRRTRRYYCNPFMRYSSENNFDAQRPARYCNTRKRAVKKKIIQIWIFTTFRRSDSSRGSS